MRNNTVELLKRIKPYGITESNMIDDMISFIKTHENPMDQNLEVGHLTGSAWIVNKHRSKALFTHHQKLGVWLQLGGHAEREDRTIFQTAMREAKEESGLQSVQCITQAILSVDIHSIPERKGFPQHLHYDVQFLFEANDEEPLSITKESKDLRWIPFDQVYEYNNELSIKRMLEKAKLYF